MAPPGYIWLPGIVACIARSLSPNEVACTLRLVHRATSEQLANSKAAQLSLPSPTRAFRECWTRPSAFCGYTRKQRVLILCLTAASGSIANLEIALGSAGLLLEVVLVRAGLDLLQQLLEAAAAAAQLDVCQLLLERGAPWGESLESAAKGGHRHACEWLLARGCPFTWAAVLAAASGGHEGLTHLLMARAGRAAGATSGVVLAAAAEGLGLEALMQLHRQLLGAPAQQGAEAQEQRQEEQQHAAVAAVSEDQQGEILAAAAGSPTPDWRAKVEWLEGLGYPRTADACTTAADCAALDDSSVWDRLQWLIGRGYPHDGAALHVAASRGHLTAVRFLVEQAGARPNFITDGAAALRGRLAVLQFLKSSGFPVDAQSVVRYAAEGGHLPVVAWALEALGVIPGKFPGLLDTAALSGSVELMAWLRERGWAWGGAALINAAACGCEAATEWMVEQQGCPLPADGQPYVKAAHCGDVAMIRCLARLGCPWGPPGRALVDCIRDACPLAALRLLLELGCPPDWDAAVEAAEAYRYGAPRYGAAVLEWLGEERRRGSVRA